VGKIFAAQSRVTACFYVLERGLGNLCMDKVLHTQQTTEMEEKNRLTNFNQYVNTVAPWIKKKMR